MVDGAMKDADTTATTFFGRCDLSATYPRVPTEPVAQRKLPM